MLSELMKDYEAIFNEKIELDSFWNLDEEEQTKILRMCIKELRKIYELNYFNDNYMEEVI